MRPRTASILVLAAGASIALVSIGGGNAPTRLPRPTEHAHEHPIRTGALVPPVPAAPAPAASEPPRGPGGRAVAHHAGGGTIKDDKIRSEAPVARLMPVGLEAWEPTLGLTKDGDVFYTAFQSNTQVDIIRSNDEGRSWEVVSPTVGVRNTHVSFDPYVWVDPWTDRIYTSDLGPLTCSMLSWSDDKGETWITNPVACGRPVNDHQTIFGGPPVTSTTIGYENIIYYCYTDLLQAVCSKSIDGGITFAQTGAPAFVAPNPTGGEGDSQDCNGQHGHGVVDERGWVFLPKGHCDQPWLAISEDEGATWSRFQVADLGLGTDPSGFPAHEAGVAVDAKGNIYFTWVARDRLPYLAISRDDGATWSQPMMIGAPGVNESSLPSIDVGAPGKIAVAYMGTKNSPGPPWPMTKCDVDTPYVKGACEGNDFKRYAKTTWDGYVTTSANVLAKDPIFYSGPVNDPRNSLTVRTCGQRRCANIGDFIDVVIGPEGTPWAAFVDLCGTMCSGDASNVEGIVGRFVGGPNLR